MVNILKFSFYSSIIEEENMYYCGIDLGGTNIKVGIFDQEFNQVCEIRKKTNEHLGPKVVISTIVEAIHQAIHTMELSEKDLYSIGMGVPGIMDIEKGISIFSPNFTDWSDVPIIQEIKAHIDVPIFIDNDVRVNLYGEWFFGKGKGKENLVLLTIGTGLGAGVIVNNQVLYGATNSAGEVGHMNIVIGGRECKCGSKGCLGRYVSARGIQRTFMEKVEHRESIVTKWLNDDYSLLTPEIISKGFDSGDPVCVEVFQETGEYLGYGLKNIMNLFNPERIIIGGGVSKAGDRILNGAKEIVSNHALKVSQTACDIVIGELSDFAGVIGAAAYGKMKAEQGELNELI